MLAVLSPAKTLDFEPVPSAVPRTRPRLLDDTDELVEVARGLSARNLAALMSISEDLANLNQGRFENFTTSRRASKGHKQAALAFRGDVYIGLDAPTLSTDDLEYAQGHLRILSGLYGLLRPLDLIQPYRLEMGTKLRNGRGKDLYEFWGATIAQTLKRDLRGHKTKVLVNLASNEYFRAARAKEIGVRIVTPQFKEWRDGKAKVISFSAKRARGMMARYLVENRIEHPEGMLDFEMDGYRFDPDLSGEDEWVFARDQPS